MEKATPEEKAQWQKKLDRILGVGSTDMAIFKQYILRTAVSPPLTNEKQELSEEDKLARMTDDEAKAFMGMQTVQILKGELLALGMMYVRDRTHEDPPTLIGFSKFLEEMAIQKNDPKLKSSDSGLNYLIKRHFGQDYNSKEFFWLCKSAMCYKRYTPIGIET